MRAVFQRVSESSVEVGGEVVGRIGPGAMILLGVGEGDTEKDVVFMAEKIAGLRIYQDDAGKMNRSVQDVGGEILVVSQFTLYADTSRGRRPSFIGAGPPEEAKRLYEMFCERLRTMGFRVAEGVFQAHMKVTIVNDGPVTIILDSRRT